MSNFLLFFYIERVRERPYIEKASMINQTKYVGENVSIVCYELITGTIPDFRWLKWKGQLNESLLRKYLTEYTGVAVDEDIAQVLRADLYRPTKRGTKNNSRSVVQGVELNLNNVTKEDSGYYTCIATNHISNDHASMYLEVVASEGKLH